MKSNKWLTFLHIGQFLLFCITISYFFSATEKSFFIGQYIILMMIFRLLSKRNGFILLIAYNLITALGYLYIGFIGEWQVFRQLEGIIGHIVLVSNIAVVYGVLYTTKSLEEENVVLRKEVEELTCYVGTSELLTKQEYERRSRLIKMAMERRREIGYEIRFLLIEKNFYVNKAVFTALTDLALETFRNQYDLVGKSDEAEFIVLLQNTDENGMRIALNRYYTRINENLDIQQEELIIDIQVIGSVEGQVHTA